MKIILLTKPSNITDKFYPYYKNVFDYIQSVGNTVVTCTGKANADLLRQYDHAVSYFYPHILKEEVFSAPRFGTTNIHISALPYGRGACPNVWAIVNGVPAGVTWHWMDKGVDTGNILFGRMVEKFPTDTAEDLYWRLLDESVMLVQENLNTLVSSLIEGKPIKGHTQPEWTKDGVKTRKVSDLGALDNLEALFGKDVASNFVDVLRARTFSGHESAYVFDEQGRKVFVRVNLRYE